MDASAVMDIGRNALLMVIMISAPMLGTGLLVGLIVGIIQAATSINEMTLTFVPKIIVVYLSLLVLAPYMFKKLEVFTDHIIQHFMLALKFVTP